MKEATETWDFPDYPDNWEEISRKVKKRDKWTCQTCGRLSNKVDHFEAHHIKSLRNEGTSELKNLITLCDWCHGQIHPHKKQFIISSPPTNRSKALKRTKYLKQHPEISAKEFKKRFGSKKREQIRVSSIFPFLMVLSFALLLVNFILWLGAELLIAIIWGISQNKTTNSISARKSSVVSEGKTVTVKNESNNQIDSYTIRASSDIDLKNNVISPESAVGGALMGHGVGDTITVEANTGKKKLEILEIDEKENSN